MMEDQTPPAKSHSRASNYTVPSASGRKIVAIPLELAMKKRPPTIAVVY